MASCDAFAASFENIVYSVIALVRSNQLVGYHKLLKVSLGLRSFVSVS